MTQDNTPTKTLRDEFAIAALPVAWEAYHNGYAHPNDVAPIPQHLADHAYQLADAMLAAREGGAQ